MDSSKQHLDLIEQAVRKWCLEWTSSDSRAVETDLMSLVNSDANKVCDALLREFLATGLNEDSEPTARGLQLEAAIDWVRSRP